MLRSARNYNRDEVSWLNGLMCNRDNLPSLAQQQFKTECDINEIVRRFGITGKMPENFAMPVSGDFTAIGDYHTAMNEVIAAQEEFLKLPASMRAKFHNDPGELMRFLSDEKNREDAVKMGLVKAPERDRMGELIAAVAKLEPTEPAKK